MEAGEIAADSTGADPLRVIASFAYAGEPIAMPTSWELAHHRPERRDRQGRYLLPEKAALIADVIFCLRLTHC
jgi:hypothetical protein